MKEGVVLERTFFTFWFDGALSAVMIRSKTIKAQT
jgi:hypothetical protein